MMTNFYKNVYCYELVKINNHAESKIWSIND